MQLFFLAQQLITKRTGRLLLVTLLYYVCLVFVNANLHLLVVTTLYALALYWLIREWWLVIWFVLLITLPFAKGRTFVLDLIPKEDLVARNAVFDINYIFSFYLSDGILLLFYWVMSKKAFSELPKIKQNLKPLRWIGWVFFAFLLVAIWPHRTQELMPVVLLSVVQLIKTGLLFLAPLLLITLFKDRQKQFLPLTQFALLAVVLFQTALAVKQFFNGGPLGWYIEAVLPLGNNGQPLAISTLENGDLLRVTGSFFDPSLLGTVSFSLLIWLWQHQPKLYPQWVKWLSIFAITLTIILTSNRLLILSLFIWWGYHCLKFFKLQQQQKKLVQKLRFNWLLVVGLVLLASVMPYLTARLSSLNSLFAKYGSGTYRLELAQYAHRLATGQPWGVGLNLSPYYLATQFDQETVSFDPAPPHNLIFQLLAETGFAGVALVLWLIYLIYRPSNQAKLQRPQFFMTAFGMAGLAFLYCAQFYPVFINQIETFSWLMLFLGLYWAQKQNLLDAEK